MQQTRQEVREFPMNGELFNLSDQVNEAIKVINSEGHKVTGFYMGPESVFLLYEKPPPRSISIVNASHEDMDFFRHMMAERGEDVMELFDGAFVIHADHVKIERNANSITLDGAAVRAIAESIGFSM